MGAAAAALLVAGAVVPLVTDRRRDGALSEFSR
jgi:hypothetical protein